MPTKMVGPGSFPCLSVLASLRADGAGPTGLRLQGRLVVKAWRLFGRPNGRRTFGPPSRSASRVSENKRGLSSAGRASALQAEGHRFDPDRLHHSLSFVVSPIGFVTLSVLVSSRLQADGGGLTIIIQDEKQKVCRLAPCEPGGLFSLPS